VSVALVKLPSLFAGSSLVLLFVVTVAGCASTPRPVTPPTTPPPTVVTKPVGQAKVKFEEGLDAFVQHDEKRDWSPATCAAVVAIFDEATALQKGPFAQADFNAGLTYQRCGDDKQARARFEKAAKEDSNLHAARAKLALYRFRDDGNADAAIEMLGRAVADGKFSDVAALVDLAAMQMARDGSQAASQCKDDMDCAKLNLHRALALDDAYMPAHNQLALYYFGLARKRAGATKHGGLTRQTVTPAGAHAQKRGDVQQLELASLVCSQAIQKNPGYAAIHNTHGLIQNELGRVNNAVAEFKVATDLDPKFFEAQMNLAALNLGFRGFAQAQDAYRKALEARPNDYDAHLGMAVALRGPIVDEADEKAHNAKIAAVEAELAAAKKIDPNRPDAFYNEAILMHELKSSKGSPTESIAALEQTEAAFNRFLEKAKGKSEFDAAVAKTNDRLKDIATTKDFLKTSAGPSASSSGGQRSLRPEPKAAEATEDIADGIGAVHDQRQADHERTKKEERLAGDETVSEEPHIAGHPEDVHAGPSRHRPSNEQRCDLAR
jgi:tetratricopeptide (TPR) repeat protein